MLSRFERGQRLPVAARLPALLWIVFFYSLNIPKMVDFRGFKHPDVPEGGRGGRLRMIWHRHVAWGEYRCGPRARCSARRPMTKYCGFPTADALPGPSACILASRRGRH
ncbi:hypothetical protein ACOMHN_002769 [Nucella lapillus]